MDLVTSAQYSSLKNSFARDGIDVEVAWTPAGDIDYIYAVDRLLAVDRDDNLERLQDALPGVRPLRDEQEPRDSDREVPRVGDLVVLTINATDEGDYLSVPDALNLIDERLGDDALRADGSPLATPDHVVHITKICPAGEPEVPSGYPVEPWPPVDPAGEGQNGVRLLVVDTGLLEDTTQHPWLTGVTGEPDLLGPLLPSGQHRIPQYVGHGTFAAGMARCMAPRATVFVADHFTKSGGELESVIIAKLEQRVRKFEPDLVCLPAGTYNRRNWRSLSFDEFHRLHPELVLIASAGNDTTNRPFYPAAFDWVVGVGALGTDEEHRAWFSNYGASADVYALGEGTVNAYAAGLYTYQEPPKRPAQQSFTGMARWDGTSFSAPIVAGLIAAEMARTGNPASVATQTVMSGAIMLPGVGPALQVVHP